MTFTPRDNMESKNYKTTQSTCRGQMTPPVYNAFGTKSTIGVKPISGNIIPFIPVFTTVNLF